jgi:hypothetical protein
VNFDAYYFKQKKTFFQSKTSETPKEFVDLKGIISNQNKIKEYNNKVLLIYLNE